MFCTNCGNKIKDGHKFCTECGHSDAHASKSKTNNPINFLFFKNLLKKYFNKLKPEQKKLWIISTIILVGAIILTAVYYTSTKTPNKTTIQDNTQSVVDIWCDNGQGGSGTIFTTDGTVLTNNHVIAGAVSCKITIPNTLTGGIYKIYEAAPVIVPVLSKKYDVATLKIDGAYTDSDGKTWGVYPTIFSPFILPKTCDTKSPSKLGDSVRIYGYPVTSGGYNLTITDGIISSFSDDGNILTSAQIDSGNSGGLAVDQNGCWLGIPSAVVSGNYQNLGVIIPGNVVETFLNNVPSKLNPASSGANVASESAVTPQESDDQICHDSFGTYSEWSGQKNSKGNPTCLCQTGYSWDVTGKSCTLQTSLQSECVNNYGSGSYSYTQGGKAVCGCSSGYIWNSDQTACVVQQVETGYQVCADMNATWDGSSYASDGSYSCACNAGYISGNNGKTCVVAPTLNSDQKCAQKYNNSYSTIDPTTGSNSCSCKPGYYWDNQTSGQAGNCYTATELNQSCNSKYLNTHWDGTYGSNGGFQCDCKSGYTWNSGQTSCY
jgi:hypothetical protein